MIWIRRVKNILTNMKFGEQSLKYKIVERRAKDINIFWKCSIITLMVCVLVSTYLTMSGFRSLMWSFDDNCFINAKLYFSSGYPGNITKDSIWGSYMVCEYVSSGPLIIGVIALFWLVMFTLCGRGGYDSHKFFTKPWEIVMPSFVFFATVSTVETAYTCVLSYYLTKFCEQLEENFGQVNMNCGHLIGFYSLQKSFAPVSANYYLTLVSSRATLFLWLISTIIMLLRMLIGADFHFILLPATGNSARHIKLPEMPQWTDNSNEHLIYMDHRQSLASRTYLHEIG